MSEYRINDAPTRTVDYIIDTDVERIKFAREAAEVNRVHTIHVLGEYNVGLHTHNMLSMLRILYPNAPTDLIWAIHEHDLAERLTGDIPAPAKWAEIVDDWKLNEYEAMVNKMIYGSDSKIKLSQDDENWLNGLDMLELFCWTRDQLVMGNLNVLGMKHRIWRYFLKNQSNYSLKINDMFFLIDKHPWRLMPELGDFEK